MTVTYTPAQTGTDKGFGVWDGGTFGIGGSPTNTGGLQFTIPAPNELLFRSLTLTLTPTLLGGSGTLAVGLCRDISEPVVDEFSNTNLPTSQATIPVYSATHDTSLLVPISMALSLGVEPLQTGSFIGGIESAMQVLGNSDFQGNVAFVITFSGTATTLSTAATLVGDETPFLTGLPTTKRRYSRADWCPRCGRPVFREQLVRDGYTKSLVCSDCWDRDEQRWPPFRPPKEINPR